MRRYHLIPITLSMLIGLTLPVMAQDNGETTPTPVPAFDLDCANPDITFRIDDVIQNNSFESDAGDTGTRSGWVTGDTNINGILTGGPTQFSVGQLINHFIRLGPNASIITIPSRDRINRLFRFEMCYRIEGGGELIVTIQGVGNTGEQFVVPEGGNFSTGIVENNFTRGGIRLDLSLPSTNGTIVQIQYTGNDDGEGVAFIDNIQLYPSGGDGEDPTPTPTVPITPTPTPTPTPGGEPTPTPTFNPVQPTWTPTPQLQAESVQILANPPMMVVSPDDFVGARSHKKQVNLDIQVVGSDGRPIDILAIDPDATVQFDIQNRGDQVNAGMLLEMIDQGENTQQIRSEQIRLSDLSSQGDQVVFVPTKEFNGTVRIAVTIEYDAIVNGDEQRHEIRGTVPIVMRTDPSASLTQSTGSFDPLTNRRAGRQPGDRGFRPDIRTNLYFRERFQ